MIRLIPVPFALVALALISAPVAARDGRPADAPPDDMPAGFHDALQACAAAQGATLPAPGEQPPTPDHAKRPDRKKMDECMSEKGFEPPKHGGRHHADEELDEDW